MIIVVTLLICITFLIAVTKATTFLYEVFNAWLDTKDGAAEHQKQIDTLRAQLASLEDRHAEVSQKVRQALGQK